MSGPVVHGGMKFLRTGIIPRGKLHIARLVDGIIAEMVKDLGGENEVTASQKIIISTIRQDLVFLGLVNEWIAQQPSIINGKGEVLSPLGGFYLACQNTVTRNCRELGLKRTSPVQSLEGYLEAKVREAHSEQSPKPTGKQTGVSENAPLRASGEGIEA